MKASTLPVALVYYPVRRVFYWTDAMQDWIKMRTDIYRDPKVCLMADYLMDPKGALARYVNQNAQCDMTVTRNVIRCATVGATLAVWGVMRHRGKRNGDDLVCNGVTLAVLDDIADLPGFGDAMEACGWAVQTDEGICFPRFFSEYNVEIDAKGKSSAAERQARYRQNKKAKSDGGSDVTRDVTRNGREEKRREEKSIESVYKAVEPQTQKPIEASKPTETTGGIAEVIIPGKMKTPACEESAAKWFRYLQEKGADYKRPDLSATALEAWWREMARIGPAKFPEAVERSMAGGHLSVKVLPDPKEDYKGPAKATKPESNDDWLHTLSICRKYSSATMADTMARKEELTAQQLEAVREVGLHRIANCDSFDYKQVSEMFMHALRKVST